MEFKGKYIANTTTYTQGLNTETLVVKVQRLSQTASAVHDGEAILDVSYDDI